MMPLSAVVADVLGQLKLGSELAPEACRLTLKARHEGGGPDQPAAWSPD